MISISLNYDYSSEMQEIEQLKNHGFKEIRIFSLVDGKQIKDNLENIEDPWLYYLCEKE